MNIDYVTLSRISKYISWIVVVFVIIPALILAVVVPFIGIPVGFVLLGFMVLLAKIQENWSRSIALNLLNQNICPWCKCSIDSFEDGQVKNKCERCGKAFCQNGQIS